MKNAYIPVGILAMIALIAGTAVHEARSQKPDEPRVAKVSDLMKGIHMTSNRFLGRAIAGEGPASDEDWAAVSMHTALMNESGHVLMQNQRAKDATWAKAASDLRAGSAAANKAAEAKNLAGVRAAVTAMRTSCQTCHDAHRK